MALRGPWAWLVLILLALSLGANLFLAGFFAERWRSGRMFGSSPMSQFLMEYPPEMRRAIGGRLWADRAEFRATFDEMRRKRRELVEAMRAPTLDLDAIRARMGELRQHTQRVQQRSQEATIEVLRGMSAEERARIGERGPGRGGMGRGGPDGPL